MNGYIAFSPKIFYTNDNEKDERQAMLTISKGRFIGIWGVCLLGLIFAVPNVLSPEGFHKLPTSLQHTINLGLELRGGSHLQLEVDLKTVTKEYLHNLMSDVRKVLRQQQIGYVGLNLDNKGQSAILRFTLRDKAHHKQIPALIYQLDKLLDVVVHPDGQVEISLSESSFKQRNQNLLEQSIEVVRRRVDEAGTKEPIIQCQGEDRIILQLPGIDNPSEVKNLIGKTAKMTFQLVDMDLPEVLAQSKTEKPKGLSSHPGIIYLPEVLRNGQVVFLPIKKQVSLGGEHLLDAHVSYENEFGKPAVSIKFNQIGARKMADMSAKNFRKRFAIVLDGEVISAPAFQAVISDSAQITGSFTVKEANDLALLLRAGSLPAPLKIIEERTVGPSLGSDSIRHGQVATLVAFALVAMFMIACYGIFGFFADIALFFNLILLFAGLSLLQATLTLPGIAGIALTIGMAVDANVLIYERIKEELRTGGRPIIAIMSGYKRAMTTILDSNLTTLIGAAVLFEFGTGPIRGFSVTLALGIVISLFTSLSLTRLLIAMWVRNRRLDVLPI